ncbi:MAG: class I SAM-dependent rRNA methyltransferase, partial [Anaerolineales bacterium]
MPSVILNQGREKSLLRRHPWIFSGAIHHVEDEPALRHGFASQDIASGETVDLLSFNQQFLARASYSPHSQIRARVWTFEDEPVDKEFFRKKIRAAFATRYEFQVEHDINAARLIYAESDQLPGLIVDRYGDVLVLQSLTAGSEYWKETIADLLLEETGLENIYERSDADVRELEGLEQKVGILRGTIPQPQLIIYEHGLKFLINIEHGHKTGFYLDQSRNRLRVRELAQD